MRGEVEDEGDHTERGSAGMVRVPCLVLHLQKNQTWMILSLMIQPVQLPVL